MMLLYDSRVSGNCYKVRLLFAQLGIPYERQEVSVIERSDRAELLGELNPALRVPTLALDDGRVLAESNSTLGDSISPRSAASRPSVAADRACGSSVTLHDPSGCQGATTTPARGVPGSTGNSTSRPTCRASATAASWPTVGFPRPASRAAITGWETGIRSASCSCVRPISSRAARMRCPTSCACTAERRVRGMTGQSGWRARWEARAGALLRRTGIDAADSRTSSAYTYTAPLR